MQFEQSMVGKRVWDKDDKSTGIITRQYEHSVESVWVLWEDGSEKGMELWIDLEDITFEAPVHTDFESITINGKRYKLIPVEEE